MDAKFLRKASHHTSELNILIARIKKGSHPAAFLCYICFMLELDKIYPNIPIDFLTCSGLLTPNHPF